MLSHAPCVHQQRIGVAFFCEQAEELASPSVPNEEKADWNIFLPDDRVTLDVISHPVWILWPRPAKDKQNRPRIAESRGRTKVTWRGYTPQLPTRFGALFQRECGPCYSNKN